MDNHSPLGTLVWKNDNIMLKELFDRNKDIAINYDIDGFLCGMILQKYYNCKIVGFNDGRDKIWLIQEITDIDSPIYIYLYVTRPNVICIEQRIIALTTFITSKSQDTAQKSIAQWKEHVSEISKAITTISLWNRSLSGCSHVQRRNYSDFINSRTNHTQSRRCSVFNPRP